ncbi:MAG: hypothetical protein H6636_02040 [Anaerolineales bacterium]|nr:hypothetical protein [Anaerolineales bacterium]
MNTTEQQASNDWDVADILIFSTAYLPDSYKGKMLARARQLLDFGARVAALLSLASVFPEPEMTALCNEAYALAGQIENPWVRVRSLSEVYDVLPPAHKDRFLELALTSVAEITNDWHKRRALAPLARFLSEEQAAQAAEMAQTIEDPQTRTEVFSRYARVLSEEERLATFQQVPEIVDEAARVSTMLAFLPHLPDEEKNLALTWLPEVKQTAPRIQALTGLSQHFSDHKEAFVQEALALTQGITDEMDRMYTLMSLLSHLPEPEKAATLAQLSKIVEEIEDPAFKAGPMRMLARFAPKDKKNEVWQEVLTAVRQIEGFRRATMLCVLLSDLPEETRPAILDEILAEIQ